MHSDSAFQVKQHKIKHLSPEQHASQTEHILMLIIDGELKMQYKDQVTLKANMLTLIPPGTAHQLIEGKDLDVWWMSFCPHCLALDLDTHLLQAFKQIRLGAIPVFSLTPDRANFLIKLFQELDSSKDEQSKAIEHVHKSLITLILHEINQANMPFSAKTRQQDSKVDKALDFIQTHYLSNITLKDVAQAAHCSPSHLAYLMKHQTGFSVGQWIIRSRLTQACSRLLHSDQDISQLVYELGWQDVTHFIRQFKKAYGTTPAAWRKQQRR